MDQWRNVETMTWPERALIIIIQIHLTYEAVNNLFNTVMKSSSRKRIMRSALFWLGYSYVWFQCSLRFLHAVQCPLIMSYRSG
jgi:hypothetical protein